MAHVLIQSVRVLGVALPVYLLTIAGCGKPPVQLPETTPVTGEVVFADGRPVDSGLIQFQSTGENSLNISGAITDGKFSLSTAFAKGTAPGAVPGKYRAAVTVGLREGLPRPLTVNGEEYEVGNEPLQVKVQVK